MRNSGLCKPERNAAICGFVAVAGAVAVWWGFREMNALGRETSLTAAMIAFGMLAAIFGTAFFVNFMRAVRVFRDMRSGRTAIERWTVPAHEFARYREIDGRFAARGSRNDYRPPRYVPPEGVEVIFADDGVLIGGSYFSLATTGISRIRTVGLIASDPPMIEFATVLTTVTKMTSVQVHHNRGRLRVPVAAEAAMLGRRVVNRYQDILDRRVIVNPHFWTGRIKGGLIMAGISAVAAAVGFALKERNQELSNIPLVLAVAGTICAIGGLLMALIAWSLRQKQHYG